MELIGNVLFDSIQIYLLVILWKICWKKITCERFSTLLLVILLWLLTNTLVGNITYYLFDINFNLYEILLCYLCFAAMFGWAYWLLTKRKNWKMVHIYVDSKIKIIFGISLLSLTCYFFFFSTRNFMPVWGNVDEAVHFQYANAMYQRLFFSLNNGNPVTDIFSGKGYISWDERYTYTFGYHYICAVLSKMTTADIIYVSHFLRSLLISVFATAPMLFVRGKMKYIVCISYLLFMCCTVNTWFGLLIGAGYTAQLYSLALAWLVGFLVENESENNHFIWDYFIVPLLCLQVLNAYMLTGMVVIIAAIIKSIRSFKLKRIFCIIGFVLFEVIHPAILKQIMSILTGSGKIDEAITSAHYLAKPITYGVGIICAICILYFLITTLLFNNRKIYFGYQMFVWSVLYLAIYYLFDNTGYMMLKTWVSMLPLLILSALIISVSTFEMILKNKYWMISALGLVIGVVCLAGVLKSQKAFNTDMNQNLKKVTHTEECLTRDEYECIKYIGKNLSSYQNIEYIGLNGPSIFYAVRLTTVAPYSAVIYSKEYNYMFVNDGSYQTFFDGIDKRKQDGTEAESLLLVVDREKVTDEDLFDQNRSLFRSIDSVYSHGTTEVLLVNLNND